jgi:hypothetical protein
VRELHARLQVKNKKRKEKGYWSEPVSSNPASWLGPTQLNTKNKRNGLDLDLQPSRPKLCWLRVCGKTHPYTLSMYFIPFYFDSWPNKLHFNIRKF